MEVFRYIFLVAIIASTTSVGFLLSKSCYDRVKELNVLEKLINILKNKIKFTHKPLAEILEEISCIQENSKISEIFFKTSQNLKVMKIEEAWCDAIEKQRLYLNLKNEDICLLNSLGNVLGKSDIDGQMSEINQFLTLLSGQINASKEVRDRNAKMHKSLGSVIGLAIVILLY